MWCVAVVLTPAAQTWFWLSVSCGWPPGVLPWRPSWLCSSAASSGMKCLTPFPRGSCPGLLHEGTWAPCYGPGHGAGLAVAGMPLCSLCHLTFPRGGMFLCLPRESS